MTDKNFRVLLVDDDELNRRLFSLQIRDLGYECDVADGATEALAALEKERYQLVFMDCRMPEIDGLEATAMIRRRESAGARRVTIVALTAHDSEGDRRLCLAAGMDDCLIKPFQLEELVATLSKWDQPLDPALVKTVRAATGDERFRALALKFVDRTRQELAALQGLVAAGDAAAARGILHDLKGKVGMFGAARLEVLVSKMARLADSDAWKEELPRLALLCEAELREYEKTARAAAA